MLFRSHDKEIEMGSLNDSEYLIVEALNINKQLSVKDVSEILEKKNIFSIINSMNEKEFIRVDEKIYSKYKPKLKRCVRLHKDFDNNSDISKLKNAKVQIQFLDFYNKLKNDLVKDIKTSEFKKIKKGYSAILNSMVKKKIFEFYEIEIKRNILEENIDYNNFILSPKQQIAYEKIKDELSIKNNILFKGITSSGKTEIYINLIRNLLISKNQILFLVPEIALTTQLVERLKVFFPKNLLVYHSGLNINQRAELWNEINNNEQPQLIIGARSAIFLPYNKLKLIIVDEEHEQSYKQYEPSPRYHARDSALVLGNIHDSRVLLGSATPSIESYYNSKISKKLSLVELNERYGNIPLPQLKLINISEKIKEGKFREDLFHRINVFPVTLPPLRERKVDIPLLTYAIFKTLKKKHNLSVQYIGPKAIDRLIDYSWPGNVRELENTLERALLICNNKYLTEEDLGSVLDEKETAIESQKRSE